MVNFYIYFSDIWAQMKKYPKGLFLLLYTVDYQHYLLEVTALQSQAAALPEWTWLFQQTLTLEGLTAVELCLIALICPHQPE